jgi:2-dehydropantoate 2-reductase
VEIYFIARGENKTKIEDQGLVVETNDGNFIAHPKLVTSDVGAITDCDFLLICTKGYDLEKMMEQLQPMISDHTVTLPLLNGVDSEERIRHLLPTATIWQGCVYIVSRLMEPGRIKQTGKLYSLHFGHTHPDKRVHDLQQLFLAAGINSTVSFDIKLTLWEKFLFISPVASLTSYFNATVGEIISNNDANNLLTAMVVELKNVGVANGIPFPDDIEKNILGKIRSLPPDSTSSMHNDMVRMKNIELESLTGYVVRLANKLGVQTPVYEKIYTSLLQQQAERNTLQSS